MSGSGFASKKKKEERPEGDNYPTPKSLIWTVEEFIKTEFIGQDILEPACGALSISGELEKMGYSVFNNDLYGIGGEDYTSSKKLRTKANQVITNPPFSLWDDFVRAAKIHCRKFMYIGKLNYFGTYSRSQCDLWEHLKYVMPFNRYVDYQTPFRLDGLFHVGSQATGWFLWDMSYYGKPEISRIVDVQQYAKLGAFKKKTALKKAVEGI